MKLSKATPEEIDKLEQFLALIEEYLRCGTYSVRGEDGDITEDPPEELTPEEFVYLLQDKWSGVWGHAKVTLGYRTLVENACDPDCSYLEWRPDIKAFLDSKEPQLGGDNV